MPESDFTAGICFSPDFTFRKNVLEDNAYRWLFDQKEATENPGFGYTSGISFKYKLSWKYMLESGIQIASFGFKTDDFQLQESPYDPESPIKANYKYRFNFIHVPLKFNYYKSLGRYDGIFFSAGPYFNFSMNGRTRSEFTYSDGRTENIRTSMAGLPSHFGIMAGVGYEIKFTSWTFRVAPVYRRSVLVFKETAIRTHFYSAGINLSAYCNL